MFEPLRLRLGNQDAVVNVFGGGLITYDLLEAAGTRHIVYGYDEQNKAGSRGDVLFPFPGRVKNSRYTFAGEEHILSDLSVKEGHAIHGFAKLQPWQVKAQDEQSATLAFSMDEAVYTAKGFPFSLTLTLTYRLTDGGLHIETSVANTGSRRAPFGIGFHPYFQAGAGRVDDISLSLPAEQLVQFDDKLEPTGFFLPVSESEVDFRSPAKVGGRVIDACFTDLQFKDGLAKSLISHGNEKVTVWQDEQFPYLQVYSADTLPEAHFRKALAVEPQTCTGFALNHQELGLRTLAPGEQFSGNWGINPFK